MIRLAQSLWSEANSAGYQAVLKKWGVEPLEAIAPLVWTSEALPILRSRVQERGKFSFPAWRSQLVIEASKFQQAKKHSRLDPKLKAKIISLCKKLRNQGVKWRTVYSQVNTELGTDYEYSADGSLQKMLRSAD